MAFWFFLGLLWPRLDPNWQFAVIGDTQSRPRVFRKALAQMKNYHLDFAVHLGDVYWCGSERVWKKRIKLAQSVNVKWWWIIGNHELYTCTLPHRIRPSYRSKWLRVFYGGKGSTRRVFTHKGWTFLILDTATPLIPKGQAASQVALRASTAIFAHRPLPTPSEFFLGSKGAIKRGLWTRKIDSGWYSRLGPVPFRGRNRLLWSAVYNNRRKIRAVFHGHHHALKRYMLPGGIRAWCSGGGGGTLAVGHFYHWLLVKVQRNQLLVEVKKI